MNSENETAKALKKPQEEKLHFLDSIEFNKKFIEQVFPEKNQIADPAIYENSDVLEITKNHFIHEINGFDKNQNNTSVCLFSLGLNYLNKELFWSTIYGGQTKTPNVQQCVSFQTVMEVFSSSESKKEKYTKLAKTAVSNKENLVVLLNHSLLKYSCQLFVGNFIQRTRIFLGSQPYRRPLASDAAPYIRPLQHTQEPNVVAEVVLGEDGRVIENTAPDAGPDAPVTNNNEAHQLRRLTVGADILERCCGPQVFEQLGRLYATSTTIVIMQLLHIEQALVDFIRDSVRGTPYERSTLRVVLAHLIEERYLAFFNRPQPDGTLLPVLDRQRPFILEATRAPDEEAAHAEEIVIEAVDTPEVHDVAGEAIGDAIADIADYDEEDYDEEDDDYDEEDDDAVDVNIEDRVVENITIDDIENPIPVEPVVIQQQVVGDQAHEPAPIGHINVPNETLNTDGVLPDWFLDRFPGYRTPTNPTGYIDPPELVNELLHAQLTDIYRTQGTIIGADLLELYFGDDICNYMRTHTYITADTGEVARGLNTLTNVIAFIRRYAHRHCLDINTSFLSVLLTMLNTNELCFKMYTSERLHTICYTIQLVSPVYEEVTGTTRPITDEEQQHTLHIDLVAVQDLVRHIGTEYYQQTHPPFVEDDTDRENNTRG